MRRNRSELLCAAALLLTVMVAGCSNPREPAPVSHSRKAQRAKPPVQPPRPVQKQLSSATEGGARFDFRQRTDPFKPFAPAVEVPTAARATQPAKRDDSELIPIQTYEVGRFKLVGIVAGLQENRALLIDPAGKGYVVHVGMSIGNNDGHITRITSSAVEVVERFKEDNGHWRKRRVVLTMAKKK